MNWLNNICLLTDSYKVSHYKQYPPGISSVYSYFESRAGSVFPETVFFGLQYFLKAYLVGEVVNQAKIDEAEDFFNKHFGGPVFNRAGWQYILETHQGRLPVVIKAVPEGSVIPISNVMMTVQNTDPKVYWLTNYLESLLVQTWYPSTVTTQSRAMKKVILESLQATGDPDLIGFKLHDFGFRGVTCPEQAALGGAAHLVNFWGTDTIAGLILLRKFYGEDCAGFSIPAAEHSTITAWGQENESSAYRNMLEQYPLGTVAVVSDSYDVFHSCRDIWGHELKNEVENRDGVLVIRPDSGYPPEVVVKVLTILGDKFGYKMNQKGYRVLNPKVRVIQGDGIDFEMLGKILAAMADAQWSSDNIAFGSGGGLLQKLNRDTQRFAFKCSSVTVSGQDRDVFKKPVTDQGKQSKSGRLKLVLRNHRYETVSAADSGIDQLQEVFRNGELLIDQNFTDIRKRAMILD